MLEIIPQRTYSSNNYFSSTARSIRNLPALALKLLRIYYNDSLSGIEKSNRSLKELGLRFGVRADYISRQLSHLHSEGLLKGDSHGSGYKKRWITWEAFHELEQLLPSQNTSQILAIPYYDLLESEKRLSKILEGEQICGQLPTTEPIPDIPSLEDEAEHTLNAVLEATHAPYQEITTIKQAFKRSQITLEGRLDLIRRVGRVIMKKPLTHARAYFLTAIRNEERIRI